MTTTANNVDSRSEKEGVAISTRPPRRSQQQQQQQQQNQQHNINKNNNGKVLRSYQTTSELNEELTRLTRSSKRRGAAHEAQKLLDAAPLAIRNRQSYTICINGWAYSGKPQRAQDLLDQMVTSAGGKFSPGTAAYNGAIFAWSRNAGNGPKAQALLERMWELDSPYCQPTISTYTSVLTAWARSTRSESHAAEQAEALFDHLVDQYHVDHKTTHHDGDNDPSLENQAAGTTGLLVPTRTCLNAVLNAWSLTIRQAKPGTARAIHAAERAQSLLDRQLRLHRDNSHNDALKPDVLSFNTVLGVWVASGAPGSTENAEALLKQMNHPKPLVHGDSTAGAAPTIADENDTCRPDIVSYQTVIHALLKNKTPSAARRAEAILRHMDKQYMEFLKMNKNSTVVVVDNNEDVVTPTVSTYSTVLTAWAHSAGVDDEAPFKAASILKRMEYLYESGENIMARPNTLSYNSVIHAWAKSRHPQAVERAQELFHRMKEQTKKYEEMTASNNNNNNNNKASSCPCRPDVITYTSVLNAIAKSSMFGKKNRGQDKAQLAEKLLEEMEAEYERTGDPNLQPNAKTFTAVITTMRKSRTADPEQAERLLGRLSAVEMPDVVSYNAVLNVWARSSAPNKSQRAFQLYCTMNEMYTNGTNTLVQPDTITINTVLTAFCNEYVSTDDTMDEALKRQQLVTLAVQAFEDIHGRPDHLTYGNMLGAITNILSSQDDYVHNQLSSLRLSLAESTFWQCCRAGQVSSFVLTNLAKAVPADKLREMLGFEEDQDDLILNKDGSIKMNAFDISRLPSEWIERTRRDRPSSINRAHQ
uniref:Pentacotripeptide-repeat region of PRORP domain-containing protein n=1 Tax=Attheya septentrionalis TaxID=420275 RepID=A0A7S2XTP4_9STRA